MNYSSATPPLCVCVLREDAAVPVSLKLTWGVGEVGKGGWASEKKHRKKSNRRKQKKKKKKGSATTSQARQESSGSEEDTPTAEGEQCYVLYWGYFDSKTLKTTLHIFCLWCHCGL